MLTRCLAIVLCAIVVLGAWSTATANDDVQKRELTLRVLDAEGDPAAGARVGVYADWEATPPRISMRGGRRVITNDHGVVTLGRGDLFYDKAERPTAVYVWHEPTGQVALIEVTPGQLGTDATVRLSPGCRVVGTLTSSGLDALGRSLSWTNVYLFQKPHRPLSYSSHAQRFEFLLPPGEYELYAYGTGTDTRTEPIKIEPGQDELAITIDLPEERMAHLVGKPAPELRQIKGWKNGDPVTLEALRGKTVVLDFWGYWCYPCVVKMPDWMDLHDRYAEHGLVIIAVHDDSAESIADMDQKLEKIRENEWDGRDLPFLVALDGGGDTPIPGADGRTARGATTAAYGIRSFPTAVLIDAEGVLVGEKTSHEVAAHMYETLTVELAESPPVEWRAAFGRVYRLEEGEVLKRIAPPYIPERADYYRAEHTWQAAEIPDPPDSFTFRWIDGALEYRGMGFSSEGRLRNWFSAMGLYRYDYDGPADLLGEVKLPGDRIVRADAEMPAKVDALERIAREAGYGIRIEPQTVERDVVIVTGDYGFKPLAQAFDARYVHVYADDRLDPDEGAGGGSGDLDRFLRSLGSRLNTRIVSNANAGDAGRIAWAWHDSSKPGSVSSEEHPAVVQSVLDNVAAQTGLTFTLERRKEPVWFVSEAK